MYFKWLVTASAIAFVAAAPIFSLSAQEAKEDRTTSISVDGDNITLDSRTFEFLNLFGDVFERIRSDYVEETDDGELIESAINGMLTSLDPHSSYLSEKSFKEMQIQTKGEFGGLGIEVTMENGLVKVVSPIDDTPAYRAGVQAGDYISHIDDEAVMGLSLSEAVDKMRGKVGTDITITVLREGENEPLEITLTRDVIQIQSVKARMIEDDIGYVRITSFSEQTFSKMKDEIERFMEKHKSSLAGLVLDLRNNPGGLLDQAVAVSDAFLDRGEIVSTRGRDPKDIRRYSATPGDVTNGLPVVVLINGGSASASEIVSGALQDHKRAVVLGTQSFGKGSVQTVIPLPQHGAMRLTTSRYYTPSGTSIQAEGITPDIIVEQAKIEVLNKGKRRSEKDLRGALDVEDSDIQILIQKKEQKDGKKQTPKEKAEEQKQKDRDDYQLARAVDLIRGLAVYDRQLFTKEAAETKPAKATPKKK